MTLQIKLLTPPASQPKTRKNETLGFLTAALHLAPANLSGFEVCSGRSPGCTAACLHYAGNPMHFDRKHKARIERTQQYFNDRPAFLAQLRKEIAAHTRTAEKRGLKPAVRLNATSDIPWERVAPGLFLEFPTVQFYDYTAIVSRLRRVLPANYDLTFSLKENNEPAAVEALGKGANVAVVFPREGGLPATFTLGGRTLPVVDGDKHDFRPADPRGAIVGLLVKGPRGKSDTTGFVVSDTREADIPLAA